MWNLRLDPETGEKKKDTGTKTGDLSIRFII